jgi:hypothetical protein
MFDAAVSFYRWPLVQSQPELRGSCRSKISEFLDRLLSHVKNVKADQDKAVELDPALAKPPVNGRSN